MTTIRVLAFTASCNRPLFLRHCILQLQQQSYTCSHGIFINSKTFQSGNDPTNYCPLLNDIPISKGSNVKISYGKQRHQHFNHIFAIEQFDINDFDLFIKVDDDDIYRQDYVKTIVEDYTSHQWDFSGTFSENIIQNNQFNSKIEQLYFKKEKNNLHHHPLDKAMPGTYAFSRNAIKKLIEKGQTFKWKTKYEDTQWLTWMLKDKHNICSYRDASHYTYVVHESNFCQSKFK